MSKKDKINNKENKEKIEKWRILILIFLLSIGFYSFIKFLPFEFDKIEKDFFIECCSNLNSSSNSHCNLTYPCQIYLEEWIDKSRLTRSLMNKCCFSYDPNPYCNSTCLLRL